ncbi:MAG: polymer-forming cytoskeletal protein [Pseudomonadota bacterium]|nr:polymer-forming cytoskeletal protein [Pseudomonadota bacterium]
MFNRQDDSSGTGLETSTGTMSQPKNTNNTEPSVISAGLTIIGNLQSNSDVVIAGTVEGDITSRSLTVNEGAKVKGTIECSTVKLQGDVDGQVNASSVSVTRTGNINGDIVYETLSIDEGAVVEGQLRRRDKKVSTVTPISNDTPNKENPEAKAG